MRRRRIKEKGMMKVMAIYWYIHVQWVWRYVDDGKDIDI